MENIQLSAEIREKTGKEATAKLRQTGFIPAVLYGDKKPTIALALASAPFVKTIQESGAASSLIAITIKGTPDAGTESVIIKEIHRHPVNDDIIHVDFLRVSLKKAITLDVPIHISGTAPGVKIGGGMLQQPVRSVRVKCLPTGIPHSVTADVSTMEIGQVLTVKDLQFPEGVEIISDPGLTVLSCVAIHVEEEPAPAAEAAVTEETPTQPEVIGEKERDERRLKKEEDKTKREVEKKELKESKGK